MSADFDADRACHEILLRLAGRLPHELLWRLRDWLGGPDRTALGVLLPRLLLRNRVGLTDAERAVLAAAAGAWGTPRRLLDAVLPVPAGEEPTVAFGPGPDVPDTAALAALAIVRGHPGCTALWQAVRADAGRPVRVLVVEGGERPWALTATLQRVLRAHGERVPHVEVLPADGPPTDYHRAALVASAPLWRAPAAVPAGV